MFVRSTTSFDWLFARQRYWGEPFPIIFLNDTGETKAINEDDLPIILPELDEFSPSGTGDPPLSKAVDWVRLNKISFVVKFRINKILLLE